MVAKKFLVCYLLFIQAHLIMCGTDDITDSSEIHELNLIYGGFYTLYEGEKVLRESIALGHGEAVVVSRYVDTAWWTPDMINNTGEFEDTFQVEIPRRYDAEFMFGSLGPIDFRPEHPKMNVQASRFIGARIIKSESTKIETQEEK